mgnify:CR=1 FL=1
MQTIASLLGSYRGVSDYELKRKQNIEENQEALRKLGLLDDAQPRRGRGRKQIRPAVAVETSTRVLRKQLRRTDYTYTDHSPTKEGDTESSGSDEEWSDSEEEDEDAAQGPCPDNAHAVRLRLLSGGLIHLKLSADGLVYDVQRTRPPKLPRQQEPMCSGMCTTRISDIADDVMCQYPLEEGNSKTGYKYVTQPKSGACFVPQLWDADERRLVYLGQFQHAETAALAVSLCKANSRYKKGRAAQQWIEDQAKRHSQSRAE